MSLHPLVDRFLQGTLPEPLVVSLTGGGLPVPPGDLLQALAHAVDQESPHAPRALQTLVDLPESLLAGALAAPIDPPAPLRLVLCHRKDPGCLEAALLNPSLTAEIVEASIPSLPGTVLEIVLNNQVLWMQRPVILDLLEQHPEGDYAIKRRINEYRFEVLGQIPEEVRQDRLEIIDAVEAGHLDRAWSELPLPAEPTPEELEADAEAAAPPVHELLSAGSGDSPKANLKLVQRIARLSVNQRIMLALRGGKEERVLLIREPSRLIQVGVIRNGRITEGEVAAIAQMRTVNEEVLRIIANSREWMKKYPITKALVLNPRTPLPVAMTHFKRLLEGDLKLLMKDRNVPELLRREARRLVEMKALGRG